MSFYMPVVIYCQTRLTYNTINSYKYLLLDKNNHKIFPYICTSMSYTHRWLATLPPSGSNHKTSLSPKKPQPRLDASSLSPKTTQLTNNGPSITPQNPQSTHELLKNGTISPPRHLPRPTLPPPLLLPRPSCLRPFKNENNAFKHRPNSRMSRLPCSSYIQEPFIWGEFGGKAEGGYLYEAGSGK